MTYKNHITVFEHQAIKLDQVFNNTKFDVNKLKALQSYYGEKGVPYFSLIHNGIKFTEFVGVIQVGDTIIEVLPKAANFKDNDKDAWRQILIDMLIAVGLFDVHAPSSSLLKLKYNSILDLYFELFIKDVEYLLHNGLIKKYRKKEDNIPVLKGRIQFGKHIQKNITHQDRFYTCHTTYDVEHTLHFILYKTIRLLKQINTHSELQSRLGALLLYFPEMPDLKVSETTFDRLVFDRKSQCYKTAIDIAKLLLLHYYPDITSGRNDVLALMFDMNKLWEKFVYVSLRKHNNPNTTITSQPIKSFWQPKNAYMSYIKPDIVVKNAKGNFVLDTKWKNSNGCKPSTDDLRQMYVYHDYYDAIGVSLIYPGDGTFVTGNYFSPNGGITNNKQCSVLLLPVESNINQWQKNISNTIGIKIL